VRYDVFTGTPDVDAFKNVFCERLGVSDGNELARPAIDFLRERMMEIGFRRRILPPDGILQIPKCPGGVKRITYCDKRKKPRKARRIARRAFREFDRSPLC
jgi:hypothetical protein